MEERNECEIQGMMGGGGRGGGDQAVSLYYRITDRICFPTKQDNSSDSGGRKQTIRQLKNDKLVNSIPYFHEIS